MVVALQLGKNASKPMTTVQDCVTTCKKTSTHSPAIFVVILSKNTLAKWFLCLNLIRLLQCCYKGWRTNSPLLCLLTCTRGRAWRRGSDPGGRRCRATTTPASPRGSRGCKRGVSPSTWSLAGPALAAGCSAAAPPTPEGDRCGERRSGLGAGTSRDQGSSCDHVWC